MRDITPAPQADTGEVGNRKNAWGLLGSLTTVLLASCSTPVPPAPAPAPAPVVVVPAPAPAPAAQVAAEPAPLLISNAVSPRDYRQHGARHIYDKNGDRIYKGKMPPLLLGVGVMQLDLDARGNIKRLNWMRPPSDAGSRMAIERTVHAAAPFPAPVRLGGVTYTDTWLWDKSGKFQLDTLTEGQNDR